MSRTGYRERESWRWVAQAWGFAFLCESLVTRGGVGHAQLSADTGETEPCAPRTVIGRQAVGVVQATIEQPALGLGGCHAMRAPPEMHDHPKAERLVRHAMRSPPGFRTRTISLSATLGSTRCSST